MNTMGTVQSNVGENLFEMKDVLTKCLDSFGNTLNPNCIAILGPSDSNKTKVIKDFEKNHPEKYGHNGLVRPVLVVNTPPKASLKTLASEILKSLGYLHYINCTKSQMTEKIIEHLVQQQVRLLIINKMQNLKFHDPLDLGCDAADWLNGLIARSNVPTAIFCLEQTMHMFRMNIQLSRRFKEIFIM